MAIVVDYKKLAEDIKILELIINVSENLQDKSDETINYIKRVLDYMKFLNIKSQENSIKTQENKSTTLSQDDTERKYKCKDCFYYINQKDCCIPLTYCSLYDQNIRDNDDMCFGFLPKKITRR